MSTIVLKTANRKSAVSRTAVRKAVAAVFEAGTFEMKKAGTAKKTIKKAADKTAA